MTQQHKVGVPYIFLLASSACLLAFIGATFSISGLSQLFSGATWQVMVMAGALEIAKLITAGFLHHNWERLNLALRIYLSIAVVVLMMITSLGIFGYLSHAYQKSSQGIKQTQIKVDGLQKEDQRIQEEVNRLQKNIDDMPLNRLSKRLEIQRQLEPEIEKLKKRSFEVNVALQHTLLEKQSFQTEIGPLVYVAEAFGINMDSVARWLIFVFVCVFDPLAICLVFATSWAIKTHREDLHAGLHALPSKVA